MMCSRCLVFEIDIWFVLVIRYLKFKNSIGVVRMLFDSFLVRSVQSMVNMFNINNFCVILKCFFVFLQVFGQGLFYVINYIGMMLLCELGDVVDI